MQAVRGCALEPVALPATIGGLASAHSSCHGKIASSWFVSFSLWLLSVRSFSDAADFSNAYALIPSCKKETEVFGWWATGQIMVCLGE